MKVKVNEEKCIGCGSCVSLTDGNIFDFNDDGLAYAKVEEINEEDTELVDNAINYCPTAAIEKVEEINEENTELVDNAINYCPTAAIEEEKE